MSGVESSFPPPVEGPSRHLNYAAANTLLEHRPDGSMVLKVTQSLPAPEVPHAGAWLRRSAQRQPEQIFLAERQPGGGWREVSFAESLAAVDSLSQWLLDQGLGQGSIFLILSENSVHHAWLQLAALQVGVTVMAISPAYSLLSEDCERVADLLQRFPPALAYAGDARRYARALALVQGAGVPVLCDEPGAAAHATGFTTALQTLAGEAVAAATAAVGLHTVARLQLTSGSTGKPKAVQITHGNVMAAGAIWDTCLPFLAEEPLRIVDWLPWSHTAGIHGSFGMALRHGGLLCIDDGKPLAGQIGRTVEALRRYRPNAMVNVPIGLDALLAQMDDDPELAAGLLPELRVVAFGGAALSARSWIELERRSLEVAGSRVLVAQSLGSTETTMPATLRWRPEGPVGSIGLPAPGVEARLAPLGEGRFEIRFRGPSITPGYYQDDAANAALFDDEGFMHTGDVVTLADPDEPALGLFYAGRLSENFKLATGTWVSVSHVRERLLPRLRPWVQDLVLTGHNGYEIGALLFLDTHAVARGFAHLAGADAATMAADAELHRVLGEALADYNREHTTSSTRVARMLLLQEPPRPALGEISDKGYINQAAVLRQRREQVERLAGDLTGVAEAIRA